MKKPIIYTLLVIGIQLIASAVTCEIRNEFVYIKYEIGGEDTEEIQIFRYADIDTIRSTSEDDGVGGLYHSVTIYLKPIEGTELRRRINIYKIRKEQRDQLIEHLVGPSPSDT